MESFFPAGQVLVLAPAKTTSHESSFAAPVVPAKAGDQRGASHSTALLRVCLAEFPLAAIRDDLWQA